MQQSRASVKSHAFVYLEVAAPEDERTPRRSNSAAIGAVRGGKNSFGEDRESLGVTGVQNVRGEFGGGAQGVRKWGVELSGIGCFWAWHTSCI